MSANHRGEFPFKAYKAQEPWYMLRLEFYQYVDIAVRPKIIAQDRTKERQLADMVPVAEICNLLAWNINA